MAGEGCSSVPDTSITEDGGENGVSMVDILAEEQKLEEDTKAVLGDSDDHNCTYIMGYVPRQALYACMTCIPETKPAAGVCLACSFECHEGHELVELYTKRNFRCDCGNSKFEEFQCKLQKDKCSVNDDNAYNQNFRGKYCNCHRPYPDPDDSVEDEMIQCIICEDWYHGRHLINKTPEHYDEMICQNCMSKNDFLWSYTPYSFNSQKRHSTGDECADKVLSPGKDTDKDTQKCLPKNEETDMKKEEVPESKLVDVTSVTKSPGSNDQEEWKESCKLASLTKPENCKGATFWPLDWRGKLCKCPDCMAKYEASSIAFLLNEDDTVHAYEERGKKKRGTTSDYDEGLKALSSMNRIQQVEVVQGYNDLKGELKDYLRKFAENGKVVREEDIREFFSALQSKKKRRTVDLQWTCK